MRARLVRCHRNWQRKVTPPLPEEAAALKMLIVADPGASRQTWSSTYSHRSATTRATATLPRLTAVFQLLRRLRLMAQAGPYHRSGLPPQVVLFLPGKTLMLTLTTSRQRVCTHLTHTAILEEPLVLGARDHPEGPSPPMHLCMAPCGPGLAILTPMLVLVQRGKSCRILRLDLPSTLLGGHFLIPLPLAKTAQPLTKGLLRILPRPQGSGRKLKNSSGPQECRKGLLHIHGIHG